MHEPKVKGTRLGRMKTPKNGGRPKILGVPYLSVDAEVLSFLSNRGVVKNFLKFH
jgi:hypothetical protein